MERVRRVLVALCLAVAPMGGQLHAEQQSLPPGVEEILKFVAQTDATKSDWRATFLTTLTQKLDGVRLDELTTLDIELDKGRAKSPLDERFPEALAVVRARMELLKFNQETEGCGTYQSVARARDLLKPGIVLLDQCARSLLKNLADLDAEIDKAEAGKQQRAKQVPTLSPSPSPTPSPSPSPTPSPAIVLPPAIERGATPDRDVPERYIREAHNAYQNLKTWLKPCLHEPKKDQEEPCAGETSLKVRRDAGKSLDDLREKTHELLAKRGLRKLVAAEFVSGYVRTVVSAPSKDAATSTNPSGNAGAGASTTGTSTSSAGASKAGGQSAASATKTPAEDDRQKAAGHIAWSTRHWCFGVPGCDTEETTRAKHWTVDVSFGGRIGLQPALTLVAPSPAPLASPTAPPSSSPTASPSPAPSASSPAAQASHQDAFLWDLAGDLHFHRDRFEAMVSVRWGQTILANDVSVLRAGDQASLVVPGGGESGNKTAEFWEGGLTMRYHVQRLAVLHEQNGLIEPAFEASYGLRNDSRFKRVGDQAVFAGPWRRQYFRFMVRGVTVTGVPAADQDKSRLFKLSFGIDHEWGGTVPKSTKFLLQGDVDLIKAIRGH